MDCPRKWWNCIKEEAETFDVMCFAQALGVTWHPEDFTSVLRELCTLLSRRGVKHIAKSQVVHALFQAKAKLEIIDAVITHGESCKYFTNDVAYVSVNMYNIWCLIMHVGKQVWCLIM